MKQIEMDDFQRRLPGATLKMSGTDYANLVASYIARRFAPRSLKVYREIRIGKTIIGKNRCIDILCVADDSQKAFAIECKLQDSQGTVDEKKLRKLAEEWGKLPQAERAKAIQEITRDLPAKYKPIIEEYFKSLNKLNGANPP